MSVQTGICHFDDRDASHAELVFLLTELEERGPDYAEIELCGPVGMGFRGQLVAPEDRKNQPFHGPSGCVITFDGRLDRRDDLAHRLGVQGNPRLSDVQLVLLAYERRGFECFELLTGEYALVLWDERGRSLFLARSLCGTRPLFYVAAGKQVVWSSELDHLVLKSDVAPTVNEAHAIGFAYYQPDIDESPFQNVSVVPPGTYVRIQHSGDVQPPIPTWHPERVQPLVLPSDAAYEDAWRHHVEIAVTDKLRVDGPVFCELSGGLDSSTLVLTSDQILANTGRDPQLLRTVSCTYEVSQDCDESYFIGLVEAARGRDGIHVTESSQEMTLGLDNIGFTGAPSPLQFAPGRYKTVARLMNQAGARVLFNGIGGDELFWTDGGGTPELADLLAQGRLLSMMAKARRYSQFGGIPIWRLLLTHAVAPITSASRIFHWQPAEITKRCSWTTQKVKQWFSQRGRRIGLRVDSHIEVPSQRMRALSIRSFQAIFAAGYFRGIHGIYFSHPYSHQQLVDFVLSLPMEQLVRPGEGRSLMRRATRGLLPEKTRNRRSKSGTDECFCRALAREQHTIGNPKDLLVCQRGYAVPSALEEAIRLASAGRLQYSGGVRRLLSLEKWLRSLDHIDSLRAMLRQSAAQASSVVGVAN